MNLGSSICLFGKLTQEKNTLLMGLYFRAWNQRVSDSNRMTPIVVMENAAVNTNTHGLAGELHQPHLNLPRLGFALLSCKARHFFLSIPQSLMQGWDVTELCCQLPQLVQGSSDGVTLFLPPGVTWGMAICGHGQCALACTSWSPAHSHEPWEVKATQMSLAGPYFQDSLVVGSCFVFVSLSSESVNTNMSYLSLFHFFQN